MAREPSLTGHDIEHYRKHARASMAQILRDRIEETLVDGSEVEEELRRLAEARGRIPWRRLLLDPKPFRG